RHTFRYFDIPCRFEHGQLNRVSAGRTLTVPCWPLARSAQWQTRTTYDYRSPLAGRDCHKSGSTFRTFRKGLPQERKHLPLCRMLARTNQEPISLYRSSSPRPTRSREPAVPLEVHTRTTPHEPTNASQHASHTSTRATPAREPTPASHTLRHGQHPGARRCTRHGRARRRAGAAVASRKARFWRGMSKSMSECRTRDDFCIPSRDFYGVPDLDPSSAHLHRTNIVTVILAGHPRYRLPRHRDYTLQLRHAVTVARYRGVAVCTLNCDSLCLLLWLSVVIAL